MLSWLCFSRHEPSNVAAREDGVAGQVAEGLAHAQVDGDALRRRDELEGAAGVGRAAAGVQVSK